MKLFSLHPSIEKTFVQEIRVSLDAPEWAKVHSLDNKSDQNKAVKADEQNIPSTASEARR